MPCHVFSYNYNYNDTGDNRSTKSRQLPGGKREAWLPGHSDTATAIPDLEKDSPYFAAAVQVMYDSIS